jgi:hypothetical protein
VSVQYGTHVRTILLIHRRWGDSCVGPLKLSRVGRGVRRWIILITRLSSLPLGER